MSRSGKVYVQNKYAGVIKETDDGYEFAYDRDYLKEDDALPVSLTMPVNRAVYSSKTLFPFFDGLIPEGWLLEVVKRNWKIDSSEQGPDHPGSPEKTVFAS